MKASHLLTLSAAGLLAMATTASAQIVISTTNTASVITFDTNTAGIYQARTGTGGMQNIAEPDNFGMSTGTSNKFSAFISSGVASAQTFTEGYTGSGNGSPTRFQADGDGDGNTTDSNIGIGTMRVYRPDEALATGLTSNAFSLAQNSDFAVNAQFFRIQNNTGSTITDWNFGAKIYYNEPSATNISNLTFSYAIDNGVDPAAMSFTSFGTVPAITSGAVLTSLAGTLSETIVTAGVANGDYIILAFRDTAAVSGSTIFLDDISITAVSSGSEPIVPVGVDVAVAGADVQVTFDSVNGQSYQLLVSTDDMASFAPVAGASDTGDGNPLTLTDTGGAPASGSKVFYKVETN